MLTPSFLKPYRTRPVPWGPVGYVTYKRTYARIMPSGRLEEWHETVERCVRAILDVGEFTVQESENLYDHVFNLRACFAGRHLWQLGTGSVDKIGADSLQNCWFVPIDSPRAFEFAMDELMLGGGVGFSVRARDIYKLPKVAHRPRIERLDAADVDFIVPDNREGWVGLLRRVLKSYFYTGKRVVYSTHAIRARGKPIKTFGGTASGGEILVEGVEEIVKILNGAHGRNLNSIECLDIMNIIGMIVVAGNVRRSAQIAIGDSNDAAFLRAKKWQLGNVPSWRGNSNNTIECNDINSLPEEFWSNYNGEGEPVGLFNLNTMQGYGRLIDGLGYRPDPTVEGCNPCAEIGLARYESCNLFELFLPNLSVPEFFDAAALGLKVCKSISLIDHQHPETQSIVNINHRLGVGVTGYLQSDYVEDAAIFNDVYQNMEEVDREYSKQLKVGTSVKLTTVKPSGTLSLLPGVTAGCHPAISHYYIRRIQFSSDDKLVVRAKELGYYVEPKFNQDGSKDNKVMVVEFPCSIPTTTLVESQMTAVQQLEVQKFLQTYWADNSVSCTVMYEAEELDSIRDWLSKNYNSGVKSTSFLLRGAASGFRQMPYEAIEPHEFVQGKPFNSGINTAGEMGSQECAGNVCPVR